MNANNATGFLSLGSLMLAFAWWFAPAGAPSVADWSVRAIWLLLMGLVNGGIGATWWAQASWQAAEPRVLAWQAAWAERRAAARRATAASAPRLVRF